MKSSRVITFLFSLMTVTNLFAQSGDPEFKPSTEKRTYYTKKIEGTAPKIDGVMDEAIWSTVDWSSDFTQWMPYDGAAPTSETSFKILYDDKNLYIGYRCHDAEPDKIVKRMSRRDGFDGDWVEVNIDSYHDQRTAFSFTSSVSGVKGDEFISNDGNNWDTNWNPIWHLKTSVDSAGWVAEVAIPLSQLRFSKEAEQTWGLQFTRRDFRNESRSIWQYQPRNSGRWVSAFGELKGIKNIKPKRQVEIQPYVLGQLETFEQVDGSPYANGNGRDRKLSAGLDGKIGVTNDLTLDFTINPDFGQVEADPSAIRLDGFQIFFSERRPFFIENRNLFDYNISNSFAGGNYNTDNLFYSRRIGAAPHRRVFDDPSGNVFVDQPDFTTILGAAKFSGKTKNGLSVGLLESITAKEEALINTNGEETTTVIEPFSNYLVARIQQDFNEGNTAIGGILTGVQRNIDTDELNHLHTGAYSGGLDFFHNWNNRTWRLAGRLVFSNVSGSTEAITATQRSFGHGFQRPDADHLEVDYDATSLSGTGGDINIGKYAKKFNFQTGFTWRSPGLELNDIGFQFNADEMNHYYWMGYNETDPKGIFRQWNVGYSHGLRMDFGGKILHNNYSGNFRAEFKNFWSINGGGGIESVDISNNWLRGGPAFRKPNGWGGNINLNTNERKKVRFNFSTGYGHGFEVNTRFRSYGLYATFVPSDAINFSVGPSWSINKREDQYVASILEDDMSTYVLSSINQHTVNLTLRLNYNITPDLTIQYYGQPFISKANYSEFKKVLDPLAKSRHDRFVDYTAEQITYDEVEGLYSVDENTDGVRDFSFGNPDFNFMQFRSNLVARWEYTPGSEIFLVWTQGVSNSDDPVKGIFPSLADNLFERKIHNTFLIKLTYRYLN